MAKSKLAARSDVVPVVQGGTLLATSHSDLFLVRAGPPVKCETPADQRAAPLLRKLGKALSKPGISREAVFGPNPAPNFFAYSIDPKHADRMIRENWSGRKEVGRMVNGKFRKLGDVD